MAQRLVRVTLSGPDAEPGRIAAADVARAILGVERAIQRAAALIAPTKRRGTTGRHLSAVERAAHLRFVGARQGSLTTILALPDDVAEDEGALPLPVADLSESAFARLLDAIDAGDETDRQLADAIAQIGDELGVGERTDRVLMERVDTPTGPATRRAELDENVRSQMRRVSRGLDHPSRHDKVTGSLVEADFEQNTARLRVGPGGAVSVRFSPDLADDVQAALREPTELEGRVTYDPETAVARSVELRAVYRGEQLHLGDPDAFWRHRSISELAREQGITAPLDLTTPLMPDLTPEERPELARVANET